MTFPARSGVESLIFGALLMTGGLVSTSVTVTVKDAEAELPAASVAEQLTVVEFPFAGNVEPDSGVHVTGTGPSTSSVAVGA